MKIEIFIEGAGKTKKHRTECRKGFRLFFENARLSGTMPALTACGSRSAAYKDFCTALKNRKKDTLPLLLVDSEFPFSGTSHQWTHLKKHDGWEKPVHATDAHTFLMVECMESWFLADRDCLRTYFGQGFRENALPGNPRIETISKADVFKFLKLATRNTTTKGEYDKGKHSFEILAQIDPDKVCEAAPNAKRLIDFLKNPTLP